MTIVDDVDAKHGGPAAQTSKIKSSIDWLGQATRLIAVVGAGLMIYIGAGAIADFSLFDQTRGGYDAPYEGWTGQPIDWSTVDVSPQGFVRRGRVLDVLVNCTTGMIEMDLVGLRLLFRTVSERAIKVHRPREACAAEGSVPQF